jgi:hypothetical protein
MDNLGALKTEIANWLDREDQTANIPGFITLAESKMYRFLRTRENEFTKSWTGADDPFNPIILPDNYREVSLLSVDGEPIEHVSSQEFMQTRRLNYQGPIAIFTIIERQLHIWPWPEESQTEDEWDGATIDMIYYGSESIGEMAIWTTSTNPNMVPESDGTPAATTTRSDAATTRLFLVAPDAYLYGSLSEGYRFLREPDQAEYYKTLFVQVMNDLNDEHASAQFSGSTAAVSSIYGDGMTNTYYRG